MNPWRIHWWERLPVVWRIALVCSWGRWLLLHGRGYSVIVKRQPVLEKRSAA